MKKSKHEVHHITPEPATKEEVKEVSSINPRRKSYKGWVVALILIILIPALGIGGLFSYQYLYQDKVYEGVYVGSYSLGGMTRTQVVGLIDNLNKRYQTTGIVLSATTASGTLQTIPFTMQVTHGENTLDAAHLDGPNIADQALNQGRTGEWYNQLIDPVVVFFKQTPFQPVVVFNTEIISDHARELLAPYENPSQNASISISSFSPLAYEVIPEKAGSNFKYDQLSATLKKRLEALSFDPIAIAPIPTSPTIIQNDVTTIASTVPTLLTEPISLTYNDATSSVSHQWKLSPELVSKWLVPVRTSSTLTFGVDPGQVKKYLEANISKYINQQPIDAKFKMEGGKVTEFQGSQVGLSIDYSATTEHINETLLLRSQGVTVSSTEVAVTTVQPKITVADVNNLGITDIVGRGITTFHDSHTNRIKNIARAVTILNGTLIKPGETFSTLDHTAPFTTANGYLPELVIKGSKIVPELGGGLCQISTTLFRTAMNTALPITERSPHALVVNYYADPVNGNPGVDATIYEGSVDFKFTNDTGNYLLLQTDIDYTKQQLNFTFWGKPDGRKGSYTHPVVSQWISPGPAQEVVVDTLPSGKKDCQNAFTGAVASFTYSRILPTGEKVDRVFESRYKALPKICMIGSDTPSADPLAPLVDVSPIVDTLAPVN
jgi:vancomycin resistance protein YoaR